MEKRIRARISPRDQLQHPHFRGAKPCRSGRKLFEQIKQGRPEQRQRAQIRAEQIETGFRRRRPIGLPGRARRREFLLGDIDEPAAATCLSLLEPDHLEINKTQLQPGDGLRMRPKIIEQPDQLQLSVRTRVEPEFDGLVLLAEFGQAEIP